MPGARETTDEVPPQRFRDAGEAGGADDLDRTDSAEAAAERSADELLSAAREDRWHWRRRIRANPVQRRVYRCVVALVGLMLIVLGLVTGPIPGPGGIPLILLGLATWASEFEWAHRLMHVFKAQLHRFRGWTRWQQVGFWVVFFSFCLLGGYTVMLLMGVPPWVPPSGDALLKRLPGL